MDTLEKYKKNVAKRMQEIGDQVSQALPDTEVSQYIDHQRGQYILLTEPGKKRKVFTPLLSLLK